MLHLLIEVVEVINRGGEKIYPLELEDEIRTLGITGEFHIFALYDDTYGEEVALATTHMSDWSVLQTIPKYRRPKKVYRVPIFFTTATGKIQRAQLGEYCQNSSNDKKIIWQDIEYS